MAIIFNKDSLDTTTSSNEPKSYFLVENKTGTMNYEILLPIVFTILFLILLFLIYLVNTYCLNGAKSNSPVSNDGLCCLYKSEQEYPRCECYSNHLDSNGLLQNRNDNYRRSTTSSNSYKYCEESRAGFYHVQKPNNFIGRMHTFNHNYDKIYDSHPSNLILALQQRNLINQSENTTGYELPSIDEAFPRYSQNEKRPISNLIYEGQQILDNSTYKNFVLKPKPNVSRDMNANQDIFRELSILRRSYSNSKLNNEIWRQGLAKNRPYVNQQQNWPSQIMSQHQIELFLKNKNQRTFQRQQPNSKMHSFQVLRSSEDMLQAESEISNQNKIINMGNNRMIQSFRDDSLNIAESRKQFSQKKINTNLNNNVLTKTIDEIAETYGDTSSTISTSTGNKSYSGILASNKEYSSYFENQEHNLNKSEMNLERNEHSLNKRTQPRRSKTKKSNSSYSNANLNENERILVSKKSKKMLDNQKLKKRCSSTFKSKLKIECSNESLSKNNSYNSNKQSSFINKQNSKTKEKNKDNKKYSRLCKSFTFLSRQMAYKDIQNLSSPDKIELNKKLTTLFISEPNKLSIIPVSIKTQQSNYLKNLNAFRIKDNYSSSSSLYDKTKSASNLVIIRNVSGHFSHASSKVVSDAAVQTSIFSDGSSFNSQMTTLMQTNNYGSILGNFGSASIHQGGVNSRNLHRLRAYSEGNGLSDSISSRELSGEAHTHSVNLLSRHDSFTKLMFNQVETFI